MRAFTGVIQEKPEVFADRSDKSDKLDRSDRSDRSDKSDKSDKSDRSDCSIERLLFSGAGPHNSLMRSTSARKSFLIDSESLMESFS